MRLSNFRDMVKVGSPLDWTLLANVDITTGLLWWKKTEQGVRVGRQVCECWRRMDTGERLPLFQSNDLEAAWKLREANKS